MWTPELKDFMKLYGVQDLEDLGLMVIDGKQVYVTNVRQRVGKEIKEYWITTPASTDNETRWKLDSERIRAHAEEEK